MKRSRSVGGGNEMERIVTLTLVTSSFIMLNVLLLRVDGRNVLATIASSSSPESRYNFSRHKRWTEEDLLYSHFPLDSSNDTDLNICKHLESLLRSNGTNRTAKYAISNDSSSGIIVGNDKEVLYEGDIIVTSLPSFASTQSQVSADPRRRKSRAATARRERIWDFGVIPYEIDGNFSGAHKTLFKQAMRHWENNTCVKFVEKTEEHPNYIVFTEKACGCCSFVGKRGNGPQAISIGKNCDKFGIVVHELGHAVGFWHEHTRPDRDDHVVIIRENIMTGQEYNFNKLTGDEVHSLHENYDFDSIMHYARNTFSRSTFLDTILPREDPNSRHRPEIGQRIRLSVGDIAQANRLYKCPSCGRTLQEPQGSLTSPYHPTLFNNTNSSANYRSNSSSSNELIEKVPTGEKCEWRITATHGETIILNITDFDLPYSDGCKYDYLEIRDGYWHKSPLLGRFCGSNLKFEGPILSTGARMLLSYTTTKLVSSYRGFSATYEAICGGDLIDENGHLESPNFPDEYLPSKECIWRITVPEGYQVALQFHSFEIENHENCVYDFLEIRDGLSPNSTLIGTYCGYYPPSPLTSSSNQLWVRFVSDGSVQKAGFSASYLKELDECARGLDDCEHTCKNTIGSYTCGCKFGFELHSNGKECEDACGGVLEETNGTLTSPSFPNLYPSNKHCAWEIVAPPQTRITVNFTHFDLEGNNQECDYDSVEVYSKLAQDELKRHGTFCGSKPPPMISSEGNSIRIVFTSDNSVQKTGFALVFFTDQDECANDNGGCAHICRNTVGSYVCLCHNGFTLHENGHDCKEGGCKFEMATPSQQNEMQSPNYPEPYPGKKECIWVITTVSGHRVKLVFDEFDVEPQQDCSYDALFAYDGATSDSTLLGRFCGSKIPHPLISSGNTLMALFKSDGSVHRRGFHGRHSSVCGGLLFATQGDEYIYSHASYGDSMYGENEDCEWIIELDNAYEEDDDGLMRGGGGMNGFGNGNGYYIELTFLSFEVEDENDCAFDFVEMYEGDDPGGPSTKNLGRFCGNRHPPPIRSEENGSLLIRFKSDDTVNGKGFSAVYRAVEISAAKAGMTNSTKSGQ